MKQMRDALKKSGGLEALNNPSPEVLNKVLSNLGEFAKATNALKRVLEKCRNVIRFEGCVNADAWLRGAHEEPSLCSFDSWTQKNIRGGVTVGSCASDARFNFTTNQVRIQEQATADLLRKRLALLPPMPKMPSPVRDPAQQSVSDASPRLRRGLFDCPCSPSNRTGSLPDADLAEMRDALKKIGGVEAMNSPSPHVMAKILGNIGEYTRLANASRRALAKCRDTIRFEGCINADAKLRGQSDTPLCSYDITTGRSVVSGVTVGSCVNDTRFNLTAAQVRGQSAQVKSRVNEGCVAVEHLDGYVLQHAHHLMRPVLCAHGFCATPNHAIIVCGKYTSMGRKCTGDWKCIERVTLVNNLKVAANRRARVKADIVVTPYDVRFPRAAVWAVQILEDAWGMIAFSLGYGTFVSAALLLYSQTAMT